MKTTAIIIITVIFLLCMSSSVGIGYYNIILKENERDQELIKYNANIDNYNKLYNINYYNGKIYKYDDIKKMKGAVVTVINNPFQKKITVNDTTLTIYIYNISYSIEDYYNFESNVNHDAIWNVGFEQIPSKTMESKSATKMSSNIMNVTCIMISTKEVEKDYKFTVYYDISPGGRIVPPFLLEKYVTYLDKEINIVL